MNGTHAKFLYIQIGWVLAVAACAAANGPYGASSAATNLAGKQEVVTHMDSAAVRDASLRATPRACLDSERQRQATDVRDIPKDCTLVLTPG